MKTASWVIREKASKRVLFETFNPKLVQQVNTVRYEVVPILEYLGELNRKIRANGGSL